MAVIAGILIGGASRRMGQPKALMTVGGVTLLERTAAVAAQVTDELVLLGDPPFVMPDSLQHLQIIPDAQPGIGPIGGLAALLSARSESDALLLACDMPCIDARLLRRLVESASADCDAAVPVTLAPTRQRHPCCGVYRTSARAHVQSALTARLHGMNALLERMRVVEVPLDAEEAQWVRNWNSPDDLRAARDPE